jgi:transposase-like protein
VTLSGLPSPVERWTHSRRARVVLAVLAGEATVAELAERLRVPAARIQNWCDRFIDGGRRALIDRSSGSRRTTTSSSTASQRQALEGRLKAECSRLREQRDQATNLLGAVVAAHPAVLHRTPRSRSRTEGTPGAS